MIPDDFPEYSPPNRDVNEEEEQEAEAARGTDLDEPDDRKQMSQEPEAVPQQTMQLRCELQITNLGAQSSHCSAANGAELGLC